MSKPFPASLGYLVTNRPMKTEQKSQNSAAEEGLERWRDHWAEQSRG